jgi:hypothetical protein
MYFGLSKGKRQPLSKVKILTMTWLLAGLGVKVPKKNNLCLDSVYKINEVGMVTYQNNITCVEEESTCCGKIFSQSY